MVAPRATKCGHLLCYGCLLRYLDYEREHAWKKCPLCAEPIYKRDIRRATITYTSEEQEEIKEQDEVLEFRLMARNKANTVVKVKDSQTEPTILDNSLP
jgi:acetyl-CoA carboxylase beta subunit